MEMDEKYPLALPQGTILAGQYIIDHALGQGGFGITYKATDHKTGQKVAVKEFFPDSMATRTQTTVTAFSGERGESFAYGKSCFLQEAETLAEFIGNENIVKVHSYFEENGTAYFVMDFVEGTSFDQYIKEHGGRISYEEAEQILLPVMDALAAVHSRGIVHRDVTPDNIYITKDGTVKLLDFGAARYSLGDKSRSLDVVLKHGFAPKEQYTRHGKQGPFTDVYTVGASFYFAITGRRPPDSIDRLEEDDLIPPSSLGVAIPPAKEDALLQAMSVQASARFQTMGAFKQALLAGNSAANVLNTEPVAPVQPQPEPVQQRVFTAPVQPQTSEQPEPISTAKTPDKKKKWALPACIGGGAVALIAIIVIAVSVGKGDKDKETAHYDTVEELDNNGGLEAETETETETETGLQELPPERQVKILGNTPNNIANGGKLAFDGADMLFDYPGTDYGLTSVYGSGDAVFLDNERGAYKCISVVGDKIYYIRDRRAYYINRDGTGKRAIPELTDYENISRLYVSDKYYYVYLYDDRLYCIERGTGTAVYDNGSVSGIFAGDECRFTFLDGYVYYLRDNSEVNKPELCRVSADVGWDEEVILDCNEAKYCVILMAEDHYVYCICNYATVGGVKILQYDVGKGRVVRIYEFPDWEETRVDDIKKYAFNVSNQYVYYEYKDGSVYRFKADPDDDSGSFDTTLVYEDEKDEIVDYISVIEEEHSVVITSWSNSGEALIITNTDGSGEPAVLKEPTE